MISLEGTKSDRCLEQRQIMGGGGIQGWMSGGGNILYYPNGELFFCKQEEKSNCFL